MSQGSARLLARNPREEFPSDFSLGETSITIGRHPSNNLVIPLDSVSRFHARIDKRGTFFILQDLNSSNGSFVNGERVTQITLHHNDEVTFGAIEFSFHNEASSDVFRGSDSALGMSIVEFREDDKAPTTQSVIRTEDIEKLRDKSSFYAKMGREAQDKVDARSLMKLNARLSALYSLSEILRESEDDSEESIITRALEVVFESVNADRGVIMTRYSPEVQDLEVAAVQYRDQPINPERVTISRTILEQVVNQRVAILSSDAASDERFDSSQSIIMQKIHSAIAVPMIQSGHVMGVVHLDTQQVGKSFNNDDLEFVTMIASELSMALENIRMRREAAHRARLAAVGETVSGISHNIKNILLLMQGGSELLNKALEKENLDNARDSWGVVSRGIDRIGRLVRDMLEYSSNKKPKLTRFDINDLICETAEDVEDELVSKNVTLELDLEEEIDERFYDKMGLQRTLMNLIVNAMEALPKQNGKIVISTNIADDAAESVVVTIEDNGSGIPKDKLEKIFLPFFTTKGSGGTGLGLPMCKKTVEDMGGTLTVESEENCGTTFTIKLPRLNPSEDDSGAGMRTDTVRDEE